MHAPVMLTTKLRHSPIIFVVLLMLMDGSFLVTSRKRITVITSREASDEAIEMVSSILPKKFAVKFETLEGVALTYSICSDAAHGITTYSSTKGKTLVIFLPSHAALPSCKYEAKGNVIYTQIYTQRTFRYGDLNGTRNLDQIGTKEQILNYLDKRTTEKDPHIGIAPIKEVTTKQEPIIPFFVMVLLILVLLIALAVLLIQCIRLQQARRKPKHRKEKFRDIVEPTQRDEEIPEEPQPTQEMDDVIPVELKSAKTTPLIGSPSRRTEAESTKATPLPGSPARRAEVDSTRTTPLSTPVGSPVARTPLLRKKDIDGDLELFVKAEPVRSLTEILDDPVSSNEFVRYLQMLAHFTIEWYNNPSKCSVTSDDQPGSLYNSMPLRAPKTPDSFDQLLHDIKHTILTKKFKQFCGRNTPP